MALKRSFNAMLMFQFVLFLSISLLEIPVSGEKIVDCRDDVCRGLLASQSCDISEIGPKVCNTDDCITGCEAYQIGLVNGCSDACNQTLQERPACVEGCKRAGQKLVTKILDSIQSITPVRVLQKKTDSSVTLSFSKDYERTIKSNYPFIYPELKLMARRLSEYGEQTDWFEAQFSGGETKSNRQHLWIVQGLRSFSRYQFKVSFKISPDFPGFDSQPSPPVRTLPGGKPSKPTLLSITQINHLNINITWNPPEFLAGPISSYIFHIDEEAQNGTKAAKEFPVKSLKNISRNSRPIYNYITGPLEYSKRYRVTVYAVTQAGVQGEEDSSVVSTSSPPAYANSNEIGPVYLYFSNASKLYKKNIFRDGIYDRPELLVTLQDDIMDLSSHVHQEQVYALDVNGDVHVISAKETPPVTTNHITLGINKPIAISVDWLHDWIYLLSRKGSYLELIKCSLDGSFCETMDINRKPKSIKSFKVDPYHGFVFWIEDDSKLVQYEEDCEETGSARLDVILDNAGQKLGDFVIKFADFKLQVVNVSGNSILELDIQAHPTIPDLTPTPRSGKVQGQPNFKEVKELVQFNCSALLWSGSDGGLTYETNKKSVYHESSYDQDYIMDNIVLLHKSAQPVPFPMNRVDNLLVRFGFKNGRQAGVVSWSKPPSFNQLGCSAWQGWQYNLEINDNVIKGLNTTEYQFLADPDTTFSLSVTSTSAGGVSPSSKTLTTRSYPDIASASTEVTLLSPHSIQVVDMFSSLKYEHALSVQGSRIAQGNGQRQFLTSNGTTVLQGERVVYKSPEYQIGSLAYEPRANSVYVSIPRQRVVARIQLDSGLVEHFASNGTATDLTIDSDQFRLCWVEHQHLVKCNCLDLSCDSNVIHVADYKEEEVVIGISLDTATNKLYILSRMSSKYMILKEKSNKVVIMDSFPLWKRMKGPLRCMMKKCFWMQNDHLAVYDTFGKEVTELFQTRTVQDFDLNFGLKTTGSLKDVRPSSVPAESIQLDPDTLDLTFQTVSSLGSTPVFYDVTVSKANGDVIYKSSQRSNVINLSDPLESLPPYSALTVSITSRSYWARSSQESVKVLHIPMAAPSAPSNLRAYWQLADNDKTFFQDNSKKTVIVRWEPPEEANGPISSYGLKVTCSDWSVCPFIKEVDGDKTDMLFNVSTKASVTQVELYAANNQLKGPPSVIDFEEEDLVFRPVPSVLVTDSITGQIIMIDIDSGKSLTSISNQQSGTKLLAYIDTTKQILAHNEGSGQLYFADIDSKMWDYSATINVNASSLLAIDKIGQYLYTSPDARTIYRRGLITNNNEDILIHQSNVPIRKLAVGPDSGKLLVLDSNGVLAQIVFSSLGKKDLVTPLSIEGCPTGSGEHAMDFAVGPRGLQLIMSSSLKVLDYNLDKCTDTGLVMPMTDFDNVFQFNGDVYWLNTTTKSLHSMKNGRLMDDVGSVVPFCPGCQKMPQDQTDCLIPDLDTSSLQLIKSGPNSLTLGLPKPQASEKECQHVFPPTIYSIFLDDQFRMNVTLSNNQADPTALVTGLLPFRSYQIRVQGTNVFGQLGEPSDIEVKTAEGPPAIPSHVKAYRMSPESVQVKWLQSKVANGRHVTYTVHYQLHNSVEVAASVANQTKPTRGHFLSQILTDLKPDQEYSIWVEARTQHPKVSKSDVIKVTTYPLPNLVQVIEKTPKTLKLSWRSGKEEMSHRVLLHPRQEPDNMIKMPEDKPEVTQPNQVYIYDFEDLAPGTEYVVQVQVQYEMENHVKNNVTTYLWPKDNSQTILIRRDKPLTPGQPYLLEDTSTLSVNITWNTQESHIDAYQLQAKEVSNHSDSITESSNWLQFYEGTDNSWQITGLDGDLYIFRVRAMYIFKNDSAFSDWSKESGDVNIGHVIDRLSVMRASQSLAGLGPIAGGTVVGFILLCLLAVFFVLTMSKRRLEKKALLNTSLNTDMELATIRNPSLGATGMLVNNTIYEMPDIPSDDELSQLPQIKRTQITLKRYLGHGAFGDVLEGVAKGVTENGEEEVRVAVKTLRKGSDQNRSIEFLKEAKAMSVCKHENIVKFIGICMDNDPNFIIIELMEGGDLLEHLRTQRSTLTLGDLVDMCHDVAKGCSYLESIHFVHRDLAARNCLLTSTDPSIRQVKIGDFGLARDVYKNDYYRIGQNGDKCLPVRWMSPESLVDGVFTMQSDVWSFGVLLWEIMTMGQQPYPARTHQEVLGFVRGGGHLDVPALCPNNLGDMLMSCWSYNPRDRPTFARCQELIREILVFKDELNMICCASYDPAMSCLTPGSSRDTWKTGLGLSGTTATSRSQATTIPCHHPPFPLPPSVAPLYLFRNQVQGDHPGGEDANHPRNPCHDVDTDPATPGAQQTNGHQGPRSVSARTSLNYLRILPGSKQTSNGMISASGGDPELASVVSSASSLPLNKTDNAGYVMPRSGSSLRCGCESQQYSNLTNHNCESDNAIGPNSSSSV